jgi:putative transposase
LIHDGDGKFCPAFLQTINAAGVKSVPLPARSPSLNTCVGRRVRSVKDEALSRLILFSEGSRLYVLQEYIDHDQHERNHHDKGKILLFPLASQRSTGEEPIRCLNGLDGPLKYYELDAM